MLAKIVVPLAQAMGRISALPHAVFELGWPSFVEKIVTAVPPKSSYEFLVPDHDFVAGKTQTVPVTLRASEVNFEGYDRALIHVDVLQAPSGATVSMLAEDHLGNVQDIAATGVWGTPDRLCHYKRPRRHHGPSDDVFTSGRL